jgi:putative FmdB family regulatory protein
MPTYEYACPKCGIIEVFQSIKDDALAKCPQCKRAKVTRLFSGGAGVIFKGSGFWETDYNRSKDYQSKSKADSTSGTVAAGSDPTSKPVPKTQMKKSDGSSAATATVTAPTTPETRKS